MLRVRGWAQLARSSLQMQSGKKRLTPTTASIFEDAIRIFGGPVLETPSPRTEEARWLAVGVVDGIEIAVIYTVRNGRRRIITARRARKDERQNYHAQVVGGGTRHKGKGQTDWDRLHQEPAAGLEPQADADEGAFDWSQAKVVMPPSKRVISVRIDSDVLDFFKAQGRGYQTRINAVLRSYMEAKRGRMA